MKVDILATKETIFFSHYQGKLCQWIEVTTRCEARGENGPFQASISIQACGETVTTFLELEPGEHTCRCFAPTLWPRYAPVSAASVSLLMEGTQATATVSVGTHRPWVVYLLADVCTDATWVYHNFYPVRKDDADLTATELRLCESTRSGPEPNRNHYNLVHALELEYFEEFYPEQVERLEEAIRRGEITLNPFYNMTLTQNIGLEEQIRLFYPAGKWAVKTGSRMYANHQETPSIAWDMPGILADIGVKHLIKAILPYECPWAARLAEPPLFLWEGSDGSQVLLRRRNTDYVEGKFVLKSLAETDRALHEEILPDYERLAERYPFNAISLLGCYGDLIPFAEGKPQSKDLAQVKATTIAAYNAREWEYPRLVNASHAQFWEDIEGQIAERDIQLEVYRGDYGTGWDVWPACLAYDVAAWRRAQERAGVADKLSVILGQLVPDWFYNHAWLLQEGWRNLRYLADHAWNGANDANRALNAALRRQWQEAANQAFDRVIDKGLLALAQCLKGDPSRRILVFNGLGWERSGVVRVEGLQPGSQIVDAASGKPVPSQVGEEGGQQVLYFQADCVPSIGYKVFEARLAEERPASDLWKIDGNRLEGPFYALEISPITGGVTGLYDKTRGKELVDRSSPYQLNQCLYFSEGGLETKRPVFLFQPPSVSAGTEYTPHSASIEFGPCGPLFAQVRVAAMMHHTRVTSTITLYAHLDRVDIRNEIEKTPTSEKQELDFAFPFNIPGREIHFEAPGAIINPEKDQLPGAGQSAAVVRHFVDVSNRDYGVILSQADSFVVEFGHRTTTEDPLEPDSSNSTLLAMAMGNIFDANEAIRDQAGVSRFVFRYSIRGHSGGFDPVQAVHFGWEDNNELLAVLVPSTTLEGKGILTKAAQSFVQVYPENVILVTLKPGEEGGAVFRLFECTGKDTEAQVRFSGLGELKGSLEIDHLERKKGSLPLDDGMVKVSISGCSINSMKVV